MKFLYLFLFLVSSHNYAIGQENLSEKVASLNKARSFKEYWPLVKDFERIASEEEGNALALYYAAYIYVRRAYEEGGDSIDYYCDSAASLLERATDLHFDLSEINALYAYLYATKVKVNPMFRGAKMGKLSKRHIEQAIAANPSNPRPYLIRAMGVYHRPRIFGGGAEKSIPFFQEALKKFKTFKPATPQSPHWGEGLAKYYLEKAKQ